MSTKRHGPAETDSDESDPAIKEISDRLDRLWEKPLPAQASTALTQSLVGQVIGGYEVVRAVGHGAFGVVYQARSSELGRSVALKIARPEVLVDTDRLARFEGEARTAASLDHPFIVTVYEANLTGPAPYIASAFCSGPDLGRWLAGRETPVTPRQAAWFLARLAEAVHYAHERGVFHRDLKPGNILLEPIQQESAGNELGDYHPCLTDFGLAKLAEANLHETRSSLLIGTPLYMAPEQLLGVKAEAGPAIDVFALGVVLAELVTLETPFGGATYVEVLDNLRSGRPWEPGEDVPEIPADLQTIVNKCLEKEAHERYASADELRQDLERYLADQPIHARPVTRWNRFVRWLRRPQSLTYAGWYNFAWQCSVMLWMFVVLTAGLWVSAFRGEGLTKTLVDVVFVILTCHGPIMFAGLALGRGSRSAFWPSAIGSVVFMGIVVYSAMNPAVLFEHNYPTAIAKINTYAFLFLGGLIGVVLHVLAIPAWLSQRR